MDCIFALVSGCLMRCPFLLQKWCVYKENLLLIMLQKLQFYKGIDSDTSPEEFQAGFGRTRLNVRVMTSDDGEGQSAEPVKGNVLVAFTLPAGTNKVIGAEQYLLKKKIYYFVYNSLNSHLILEYDQVLNTIVKVFQDSVNIQSNQTNILNFSPNFLITGINVVKLDADNDLLYWTDFLNEPKKINIRKGKLFMAGDYVNGYKNPFNPQILFRIKQPPLYPPTYTWQNSVNGITPDLIIYAVLNGLPTAVGPGGITAVFPTVISNTNGEYNNSTGITTISTAGTRYISVLAAVRDFHYYNTPNSPPEGYAVVTIFKNATPIYTLLTHMSYSRKQHSIIDQRYDYFDGVANFNIILPAISLSISDTITVTISANTTFGSNIWAYPNALRIFQRSTITNTAPNYQFKNLVRFKFQWGYDDYERSAWSPISKYVFPDTIAVVEFGDILFQDNIINLNVPTGSSIVKKIRIAIEDISKSEFSLLAEIDKAELSLADDSIYVYNINNINNITPLEINESIKLYDNVPLLSKAQELLTNNRLVDGYINQEYDNTPIDVKITINYGSIYDYFVGAQNYKYPTQSFFKAAGVYKSGIVYYDHSNRSGLTNITNVRDTQLLGGSYGTILYVPFTTEAQYYPTAPSGTAKQQYVPVVKYNIYNQAPSWATHYQIVMTRNQGQGRYLQFCSKTVDYIDIATGSPASPSVATGAKIDIDNLIHGYNKENPTSQLVYDWVSGDRIRFINDRNDVPFDFNDQDIVSFNATDQTFVVRLNSGTPGLGEGDLFEIYYPISAETDIYYEIGECYPVNRYNQYNVHGGNTQNQFLTDAYLTNFASYFYEFTTSDPNPYIVGEQLKFVGGGLSVLGEVATITVLAGVYTITLVNPVVLQYISLTRQGILTRPAIVTLTGGDTFRTFQRIPYGSSTAHVSEWLESASASYFFASKATNINGRPNRVDANNKNITRPSTIIYSETLVPETFINGLSSVFDTNFETYNQGYGSIQQFAIENQRLIMFQELKIGQIPVEQSMINDTQGGTVVGLSPEILNPQAIYYDGELGIGLYPESFARHENAKYGIDVRRGVVWRLSLDGLTPVSEYFQHINFTAICKLILQSVTKVNIYGVYDIRFNEYVISIDSFVANGVTYPAQTIAFNEKENLWSTNYSYAPEMMVSNGVNIIAFKNGSLWKQNENTIYNNFFGVQYASELSFYCNAGPSNIKVFQAISLEGKFPWAVIVETPITDENPLGQHTELLESNFQMKEGFWYSEILKDDFTPNIVAGAPFLPNARFEGKPMRGQYAYVKLTYNNTVYTRIFAANIQFATSDRSNV